MTPPPDSWPSRVIRLFIIFLSILIPSLLSAQPQPPPGMVYIPEGYFPMGTSSGREDEKPLHFVYTPAYFIDKYEVSNAEYMEFVEATGHEKPLFWNDENFNQPDQPVVGVSWYDAMAFARWKGGRLPTEAEWEKAARGTDQRVFPWGDAFPTDEVVTFRRKFSELGFQVMEPVDGLPQGRSPYGLHHMAGNVWEWVNDWYDPAYYDRSPRHDPPGPATGTLKVLRGGNWYYKAYYLRTTYRFTDPPDVFKIWQGFRCARSAGP